MKKKRLIPATCILFAILIPLVFFFGIALSQPDMYSEAFVAELSNKFERLSSIDEPKVIVVGGSSVAFGLDSETMERELGMPVVNFGLYASLGTKLMMDLSRANIGDGDIVIISPEMSEQTLSLYFNAQSTWQAIDGNSSMLRYIATEDLPKMAGSFYEHAITKFRYAREGITLSPSGVYRSDSFNEYGDIKYDRPYNTMYAMTGIPYDTSNMIDLSCDIVSEEFIEYVNEYTKWCNKKGATVYFSFCPMNKAALSDTTSHESMIEMFEFMADNLDCNVINSPTDTVYEPNYFYDTNFHLNDAGVTLHTRVLLEGIYRAKGRTEFPNVSVADMPDLPIYEGHLSTKGNEYADYFSYEKYGVGYMVVGTQENALDAEYLEIPSSYEGLPVIAIGRGIFKDCGSLTKIKIYENISAFSAGVFEGCGNIEVYMSVDDAEDMKDPDLPLPQVSMELLNGNNGNISFMFTYECYKRFLEDYSWQQHGEFFKLVNEMP